MQAICPAFASFYVPYSTNRVLSFPPDVRLTRDTSSLASNGTSALVGETIQKSPRRDEKACVLAFTARVKERERDSARPNTLYFLTSSTRRTHDDLRPPARVDHLRSLLLREPARVTEVGGRQRYRERQRRGERVCVCRRKRVGVRRANV